MATIYRVEHADDNTGPFWGQSDAISNGLMDYYRANGYYQGKWPSPTDDGMGSPPSYNYIFGVPTVELLLYWFPHQFHNSLSENGYWIVQYEVTDPDDMIRGGHQCAFDMCEAKRVDAFCFEELDNLMRIAA